MYTFIYFFQYTLSTKFKRYKINPLKSKSSFYSCLPVISSSLQKQSLASVSSFHRYSWIGHFGFSYVYCQMSLQNAIYTSYYKLQLAIDSLLFLLPRGEFYFPLLALRQAQALRAVVASFLMLLECCCQVSKPSLCYWTVRNCEAETSTSSLGFLDQRLADFSLKGHMVNIFSFVGYAASLATTQLCCCVVRTP